MPRPKLQTFGDGFAARKVIPQTLDYAHGAHEVAHVHHRAQLVYATRGVVRIVTPNGLWMIAPMHALLIGSQVEHELHMLGDVSTRALYIAARRVGRAGARLPAVAPDALLRASVFASTNLRQNATFLLGRNTTFELGTYRKMSINKIMLNFEFNLEWEIRRTLTRIASSYNRQRSGQLATAPVETSAREKRLAVAPLFESF